MELLASFLKHFKSIKDPRLNNHLLKHNFTDILVITLLAVMSGCDTWTDIVYFAECKQAWLKKFLTLSQGIPSHDTFNRVFSLLEPTEFKKCFLSWIRSFDIKWAGEVIAIDGKTACGSIGKNKNALHVVSAFATERRLVLGQVKTEDKSNEITAIPQLLDMLDIRDSIVTIDAMGCQKSIARQIRRKGANYVLALKANQPNLFKAITKVFYKSGSWYHYANILNGCAREKNYAHGRQENRFYRLISARDEQGFELSWPGLKSIGIVESTRIIKEKKVKSVRYFLTSLAWNEVHEFKRAVRKHWEIENNLHWSLDVSFKEDLSRIRAGHAAENLAWVRKIALNLFKQDTSVKAGIAARRKLAGWDENYLLSLLNSDRLLLDPEQPPKSFRRPKIGGAVTA